MLEVFTEPKMTSTDISSLPQEVLLHIFSFLPTRSLISVWGTSTQWRDLSRRPLAARIQSSLAVSRFRLSDFNDDELDTAADLVITGYLSEVGMKTLATSIESSSSPKSVAEMRCAAALAATGHLTTIETMWLYNLKLPSGEDTLRLFSKVRYRVYLDKMTGDIGPLLPSLTCRFLQMESMKLGQAATSSLVRALQRGVQEELYLYRRVRLHIKTLLKYDGRGRCGGMKFYDDTRRIYLQKMKTWAARVGWDVEDKPWGGEGKHNYIEVKRCDKELLGMDCRNKYWCRRCRKRDNEDSDD